MVRDVRAGRVARDEHAAEVRRPDEVRVRRGGLAAQPGKEGFDVVERSGMAVLGREAVVYGEHDGRELGGEAERQASSDRYAYLSQATRIHGPARTRACSSGRRCSRRIGVAFLGTSSGG